LEDRENAAVNFEFPNKASKVFTGPFNPNQERAGMGEPVPVSKDRIWIDGCFDFGHHGIEFCDAGLTEPQGMLGQFSRQNGWASIS